MPIFRQAFYTTVALLRFVGPLGTSARAEVVKQAFVVAPSALAPLFAPSAFVAHHLPCGRIIFLACHLHSSALDSHLSPSWCLDHSVWPDSWTTKLQSSTPKSEGKTCHRKLQKMTPPTFCSPYSGLFWWVRAVLKISQLRGRQECDARCDLHLLRYNSWCCMRLLVA
jgi:hypothetical protein